MNYTVSSGATATYTLNNGDTEVVDGGTALDTTVLTGAVLTVEHGGQADQTTVSGGSLYVFDGATFGTRVVGTGEEAVASGGTTIGSTLSGSTVQVVGSGAAAYGATFMGTRAPSGYGGAASLQLLSAGGFASGTQLDGTAVETIDYGAIAVDTTTSGNLQPGLPTYADNTITVSGVLYYSGGVQTVGAFIAGDGLIAVAGAGTSATFYSPPFDVTTNLSAFHGLAEIGSGATLTLSEGDDLATGTIAFGVPGGTLVLDTAEYLANPSETVANFLSGDTILIDGYTASSAQVSDDLVQLFAADGSGEYDLTIAGARTGGIGIAFDNATITLTSFAQPAVLVTSGESDTIDHSVDDIEVSAGGTIILDDPGALAFGGTIQGVIDAVQGVTSGLVIASDGTLSAPTRSGSIDTPAIEHVMAGASSDHDTIGHGGTLDVEAGGMGHDPVDAGGNLIDNGTIMYGDFLQGPASMIGTLSGAGKILSEGPTKFAGDASKFKGNVELSGGSVEVSPGTTFGEGAGIAFAPGADPTLQLDAAFSALPTTPISGFATNFDIIDLPALAYLLNTTSGSFASYEAASIVRANGTAQLDITSGGVTHALVLDAATAATGPVDLSLDAMGGTAIAPALLSAATAADLSNDFGTVTGFGPGTYNIELTKNIALSANQAPGTIQAVGGATVILDGGGYVITAGAAQPDLVASGGPVVVTSLGGSVGLTVAGGSHAAVVSNSFTGGSIITSGVLEVVTPGGAGSGNIRFDTGSGSKTLTLDAAALPAGTTFGNALDGFANSGGQYLDLAGFAYNSGSTTAAVSQTSLVQETLTVTDGGTTVALLLDNVVPHTFNTFDDGHGGTIVTADTIACFARGTLIETDRGDVAVEALTIGDRVVTPRGPAELIRWIGRRSYAGRLLAANPAVQPILLRAGCLGDGLPRRDLRVSPLHAMFLDGVLVPAMHLVNGVTILRDGASQRVDYFHIELDAHGLLLAEGAASESFVDDENRGMFHNTIEFHALYPGATWTAATYCAPRVESGSVLDAIRRRLSALAGGRARVA